MELNFKRTKLLFRFERLVSTLLMMQLLPQYWNKINLLNLTTSSKTLVQGLVHQISYVGFGKRRKKVAII
jgi:hypothetical protein